MAKVGINTGSAANAGDGSALRAGANIINANFDEIYEYFGDGTTLDADLAGKWLAVATGINTLSNIGIGTTNPWNALTVLGNASITGVTTSSGGFSGDITGTVTGNVYNTGISTFQDVLVSGASTVTGKSTFTGIGTFSSDLYVGGNLYTLGDITYDEVNGRNISVTGIGTVAYLGVTDLNVSGFSTFSGLSTTGSDLYIGDSLYVSQDATILGVTTASGGVVLPDDTSIKLGNDDDLEIHHAAGANSYIKNNTLSLDIRSDTTNINSKNNAVTFLKANASGLMATTGILTATTFDGAITGSGSGLTGVVTSITAGSNVSVSGATGAITITGLANTAIVSANTLNVTGVSTFNNDFVAAGTTANLSWDKSEDYLQFPDHVSAVFGDSADLTIHHDGNDSRITQASGSVGNLLITNSRSDEQGGIFLQGWTGEDGISVMPHSHVNLYFNDSLKLSTSGLGVTVTGGITCTGAASTSTFEGDVKMTGNNNFFNPPSLTTTERNNATTMTAGSMIWNETANRLEYYNGSAWRAVNNSAV